MTSIVSNWTLPGVGGLGGPFIGGVQKAILGTSINTSTVGVFSESGATITGSSTQTTLVVSGNDNTITSAAPGAHLQVNGTDNTVTATGADSSVIVNGQNNNVFGTAGGDQFLLTGTGNVTSSGPAGNTLNLSTSPGATSGVTINDFRSGVDKVDVSVSLSFNHPSVQSFGITPSSVISSGEFGPTTTGAATTPSERFTYNQSTGNLYFDPDGSGSSQSTLIGNFTPGTSLAASDIHILNPF